MLLAHHTKAFLDIEILGHDLTPDGPTEHAIAFALTALALSLMLYGAYASVRDLLRWRRRQPS